MPGSQLGYLDSKERSLIIVVSGCRIMKNIQNYTHDIFFSQTYSVSSVICVNIHSVASANFDFTFDFSLFLHLCPNKSLSFIYTPSKLKKKKKKILFFLHCHYLLSDHHPLSLDYYCNIPSNLSICNL